MIIILLLGGREKITMWVFSIHFRLVSAKGNDLMKEKCKENTRKNKGGSKLGLYCGDWTTYSLNLRFFQLLFLMFVCGIIEIELCSMEFDALHIRCDSHSCLHRLRSLVGSLAENKSGCIFSFRCGQRLIVLQHFKSSWSMDFGF